MANNSVHFSGKDLKSKVLSIFKKRFEGNQGDSINKFKVIEERDFFDFRVEYNQKALAFIVVKNDVNKYTLQNKLKFIAQQGLADQADVQFIVITDSRKYLVWSKEKGLQNAKNIDDVYDMLFTNTINKKNTDEIQIAEVMFEQLNLGFPGYLVGKNIRSKEDLLGYIDYKPLKSVSWKKDFDKELIDSVQKNIQKGGYIYRYTSLSSLFEMIKDNKFQLNCIVSMNDRTEIDFIDKYLAGEDINNRTMKDSSVKYANRRFISCFSGKSDDLTLWRLYTDNASGVCLEYKVNDAADNVDFYLKKVKYVGTKSHPNDAFRALECLKKIKTYVEFGLNVDFKLPNKYIWKHFFKPFDFADEDEIRLLYFSKTPTRKWKSNTSTGIINSYVEFKLFDDALPITLNKIILGPKVPESEINKVQLKEFIETQKLRKIKESNSGLERDLYDDKEKKLLEKVIVDRSKIQYYR